MSDDKDSGTVASLSGIEKSRSIVTKFSTVARNLVERLLPYFITAKSSVPGAKVVFFERDDSAHIRLNDFVSNEVTESMAEDVRLGGRTQSERGGNHAGVGGGVPA